MGFGWQQHSRIAVLRNGRDRNPIQIVCHQCHFLQFDECVRVGMIRPEFECHHEIGTGNFVSMGGIRTILCIGNNFQSVTTGLFQQDPKGLRCHIRPGEVIPLQCGFDQVHLFREQAWNRRRIAGYGLQNFTGSIPEGILSLGEFGSLEIVQFSSRVSTCSNDCLRRWAFGAWRLFASNFLLDSCCSLGRIFLPTTWLGRCSDCSSRSSGRIRNGHWICGHFSNVYVCKPSYTLGVHVLRRTCNTMLFF